MGDNRQHDHSLGAGHDAGPDYERRTLVAFALTAGFMVVEAAGGWLSGSLALLADATHMLTDAVALALAWVAFRLGRLAADPRRTYGYQRLEVLAALINGLAVLGLSVWIVWEAGERLAAPEPVLGWPMMAVAALGMVVNLVVLRILHAGHGHGSRNINLQGAVLHVLGDLAGSVAAVFAAAVILLTGWTPIDAILSIAVAGLILVNAWRLIRAAGHILLEGTPEGFDEGEMRRRLLGLAGLENVHHVHAWSLTTGQPLVTLHAGIDADADPEAVLAAIKSELRHAFGIAHSVVQIERNGCPDEGGEGCAEATGRARRSSRQAHC